MARFITHLNRQAHLYADYLPFRFRYRNLSKPFLANQNGTILFVCLNDWVPRAKLDGVLAKAFQYKGYKPIVLTYRRQKWTQRYLRAFGIQDFLYLDDLMDAAKADVPMKEVEEALKSPSFHSLFHLHWRDVEIGRHVLSTVTRQLTSGSISFDSPEVALLLQKFLPQAYQVAAAGYHLFKDLKPDAVLFLEKGYTPYGPFFDAAIAHHLNTIQYFHGHRSDLVVMRRYSLTNRHDHPFSLTPHTWERVKAMPWTPEQETQFMQELQQGYKQGTWFNRKFLLEGKHIKTPEESRAQLGLDPGKKTAVIYSHVLWDATFFFGKNLFADYEQWLIETVKAACQNTHVNWLVKLHPDYVWKMKQLGKSAAPRDMIALQANIGSLPEHVMVVPPDTDISTYSFFQCTDYCITVRGTVGIEAPCFGIPVFTAGTGRYSGLGFTNDFESQAAYLHAIAHLHEFPTMTPEQTSLARRHAYALFNLRPIHFPSVEITAQHARNTAYDFGVEMRVHSMEDIQQAPDLQAFTEWVLHSHEEDYVSETPVSFRSCLCG